MSSDRAAVFGECPTPWAESDTVLLGHGGGGRLSAQLLSRVILPALHNPVLARLEDQAVLPVEKGQLAFTTDSYVVTPLFFPGGDIGDLAVNGTVNDLAVGGARPRFLSLGLIIEEGFAIKDLQRVLKSVAAAAARAGVQVVTGDTKVVGRGSADGLFINTSGIGIVPDGVELGCRRVRPGDQILVSGPVGEHGVAILSTREGLSFDGDLRSDTAPLHELCAGLLAACPEVHAMRDPTRGGLAASLVEIATAAQVGLRVDEAKVPVRGVVRGACELLGLDPLLVACEGRMVAFVPEAQVAGALEALRAHPLGKDAAWIGQAVAEHPGEVVLRTPLGGTRALDLPLGELLPRIC
jgi:hydrogenase expression/formation protein HypE